MKPMIQSLEGRRLLTATLTDGVLTITGTSRKDDIHVSISRDGETLNVSERTLKRFQRVRAIKTAFAADSVTSIVVNAGAANDRVALMGNRKHDFTIASTINGEDGNDRLGGGNGNDVINGGAGDDDLFGHGGTDRLNGGEGDDLVVGGKGVDTLNGDAGDDRLLAKGDSAIDIVDGGADSAAAGEDDADQAIVDDDDVVTNATEVVPVRPTKPAKPAGPRPGQGGRR